MSFGGRGTAVSDSTANIARSLAVRAEVDRVWQLLRGPAVWSLRPSFFVFELPGAERLRLCIGPSGSAMGTAAFEVALDERDRSITFQAPAPGRLFHRLSVTPDRRGRAKVSIECSVSVPRASRRRQEIATGGQLETWLSALRNVAEGREPEPGELIPASVLSKCMHVGPPMGECVTITEALLIGAEPDTVWEAVHAPHLDGGPEAPIAYGLVPGTPYGAPGEMQYFVGRTADGALASRAFVLTDLVGIRGALTHSLRPPYARTRYLVTAENGLSRLELSWTGPAGGTVAGAIAAQLRAMLQHHKSHLEQSPGRGG
jgi:hypothetical protein